MTDQPTYPYATDDGSVLGPDVRATHDATVIFWQGAKYTHDHGDQPAFPTVQGRCPACHWESLSLGSGGHITCSRIDCPKPEAADELLSNRNPVEGAHKVLLDVLASPVSPGPSAAECGPACSERHTYGPGCAQQTAAVAAPLSRDDEDYAGDVYERMQRVESSGPKPEPCEDCLAGAHGPNYHRKHLPSAPDTDYDRLIAAGAPAEHAARYAENGIDTPGCDCGHDGMGAAWHSTGCRWYTSGTFATGPAATEATGTPGTVTHPEWLREQYAAAIAADDGHPWNTLCTETQEHYLDNADAVLAVRDRRIEQLGQRLALADETHRNDIDGMERALRRARRAEAALAAATKTARGIGAWGVLQAIDQARQGGHDDEPSVREAAEAGRRWPVEKAGE